MTEHRGGRGLAVVLGAFLLAAAIEIVRPGIASAQSDFTPPTCSFAAAGGLTGISLTFQDTGSGLASIMVVESVNATVNVPSFTPGTTSAQMVTASAIGGNQATVRVKATDVDGNSVDCGRITFKLEALTQGGNLQDTLTGIQQSQSDLTLFNSTPGFRRLRIVIGRFRERVTLSDGQTVSVSLSGALVPGSNTIDLALGGRGGTGLVVVRGASSTTIACPEDPTRTIFAGGPSTGACRQFTGNQTECDDAYHINFFGEPASCFFDSGTDECIGCGPGEGRGASAGCTNTCLEVPPDPCTGPGTIPPGGGTVRGTTTGHTGTTNGTCANSSGPEAVFAWTPNFSGGARITTCGATDFPTTVYVREATCSTGTEVGCESGFCSDGSRVDLNVTSGVTYFIFVDGFFGGSGDFQLGVTGPFTCPADASRTVWAGGPFSSSCRQFSGNQTACDDAFHTSFFGIPASCFYNSGTNECVGCTGASAEFQGAVGCTNTCLPAPTCPGDATRTTFAGGLFTSACRDIGTNQTACEEAFHLTIGPEPATCVFDVGENSCRGCGPQGQNGLFGPMCTDTCLTATDPCTAPTVIPAEGGVFEGTTSGKGSAMGTCGNPTGPEKAFAWTPSTSGTATIETCGGSTDFQTILYIREADCSTGTENACNPGACASGAGGFNDGARITPTVTQGVTYYIFVDGNFGEAGNFTLTVIPPE